LCLVARVAVVVDAGEIYGVSAEPEEALLAVVEIEGDVDAGAFEGERVGDLFCDLAGDGLAVFDAGLGFALLDEISGAWGTCVWGVPQLLATASERLPLRGE